MRTRLFLGFFAAYGSILSFRSTRTIIRLRWQAETGDRQAQNHFTQTRYARVFGPRNSDLGLVFYPLVLAASISGRQRQGAIFWGLLCSSAISILVSLYLLWALFFRLRVVCPICLQGHLVNFGIFALLWRMRRRETT